MDRKLIEKGFSTSFLFKNEKNPIIQFTKYYSIKNKTLKNMGFIQKKFF